MDIIFVNVDNMTLVCLLLTNLMQTKSEISSKLKITDNGELHWLFGIKIKCDWSRRMIALLQCMYIKSILDHYSFADSKPLSQPMDTHIHLLKDQSPVTPEDFPIMQNKPYREAAGALMWLAVAT